MQKSYGGNYDRKLFAKLRKLRKAIADEENIPPYVVFNDATLIFTKALQLARAHAVDAQHFAGAERHLLGHLDQRRVVEDHIWRNVLFIGNRFTPQAGALW